MPRRQRTGGVTDKPRKINGWVTGKGVPGPIRRRLRSANLFDRLLIAISFFIGGAITTGATYFYLSTNAGRRLNRYGIPYEAPALPLETLTGLGARYHFLLVCFVGGLIAFGIYIFLTLRDPYGTTAADKAAEEEAAHRKKDRFAFLKEREACEQVEQADNHPPANPS